MNNMDEELKPLDNNLDNIDLSQELITNDNTTQEEDKDISKFVEGFPEWDLLPTNQVVRRVTRK